jgi:hypothetical protein
VTPSQWLGARLEAKRIFASLKKRVGALEDVELKVSKSQIAFWRGKTFGAVWRPGKYLKGETAPLVLSVFLPRKIRSKRWKEITRAAPGRYTHHLELWSAEDVDAEVGRWLKAAWTEAV